MRYDNGDRVEDRQGRTGVVIGREAGWVGQDSYLVCWDENGRQRWKGDTDLSLVERLARR